MQRLTTTALLAALATAGSAAELAREQAVVGDKPVTVSSKDEITITARDDSDVKNRELWYSSFDGSAWGTWQKHGLSFARDAAITWAPPEGHWRIYVRIEEISGQILPVPDASTKPRASFIIDRTAPSVAVTWPSDGERLRGGQTYQVTWEAQDPHLHSTPITILYARSGEEEPMVVAENIPNTGSYDWTTPFDMTATGKLEIVAADKALNRGSASVSGLVIDAIAPSRSILGPSITNRRDNAIEIKTTDAGPAGMASVQLFYSTDDGANWTEGPRISEPPFTSIAFTAPADGAYQLYLVATDVAGNANPAPSGKAGAFSMLVDTEQPVISLAKASGISAVGGDANRLVYKPGDKVQVAFAIKDANVKPDGISVHFQAEEGARWEQLAAGLPPTQAYEFAIPDISTSSARIKVSAIDLAGNSGEVISEQGFEIDNLVETGDVQVDL